MRKPATQTPQAKTVQRELSLSARVRTLTTRGDLRKGRREGSIPAVVYGGDLEPLHLSLSERELERIVHKRRFSSAPTRITLEDGKSFNVLARQIQFTAISNRPVHIDFLRITPTTRLSVPVSVHFSGHEASPGLKLGGVLNIVRHEITLIGPISDMPERIEVDLTGSQIGDSLKSDRITLPRSVRFEITGRSFVIATIAPPNVEPTATTTETTEAASTASE